MRAPRVVVGLAILALLATSACSSSAADHVGVVHFSTKMLVNGEDHVRKTFIDVFTPLGSQSCSRAAAQGDQPHRGAIWRVPSPSSQDPDQVEIETSPRAYRGPGRYSQHQLLYGSGAINIGANTYDLLNTDGSTSLVVNDDGSGTVTFRHSPEEDDKPFPGWKGGISGSISWTCMS